MVIASPSLTTRQSASTELVFSGARIVGPETVMEGSLLVRDGVIADVSKGASRAKGAVDCEGDLLSPGLVELHTDAIERHLRPRAGVDWPAHPAALAHDREFAAHGVTTLFDAMRVGSEFNDEVGDYAREAIDAIDALRDQGLLKSDHYLHLRCEICAPSMPKEFEPLSRHARLRLISLMDHTVGQRQLRDEEQNRVYYLQKRALSEAEMAAEIAKSLEFQEAYATDGRRCASARAAEIRAEGGFCALAGHDDATEADVAENLSAGATIAEFPTTLTAARLCREAGMMNLMGAPNLLRGKSHSGNVSALALAEEGLVDILSSDYAPASLLSAAFALADQTDYSLPAAIATATRNPALAVGLTDRGAIAPGLRADLLRIARKGDLATPRGVWSQGERIA